MVKMLIGAHSIFFQLCIACGKNIWNRQFGNSGLTIWTGQFCSFGNSVHKQFWRQCNFARHWNQLCSFDKIGWQIEDTSHTDSTWCSNIWIVLRLFSFLEIEHCWCLELFYVETGAIIQIALNNKWRKSEDIQQNKKRKFRQSQIWSLAHWPLRQQQQKTFFTALNLQPCNSLLLVQTLLLWKLFFKCSI